MNRTLNTVACIVATALSPAALAQYTDLPDTVIAPGESVEIDLNADGLPDLIFRADASGPGGTRYTVETGPNTYVHGSEADGVATAAGLPPGVIIGFNVLPDLQGILLLRDGSSPCAGEWCDPSVRFLGVRVGWLYGWVRIRTASDGDGVELSILDLMAGGPLGESFTLINGFYTEQICDGATTRLRVWVGGIWSNSCVPGPITAIQDGHSLRFEVDATTTSGCFRSITNWVRMITIDIDQPGVSAFSSTIVFGSQSTTTDRGLLLLGCCPADWNSDGVVNFFDVAAYLGSWQESAANATPTADLNLDGVVNFGDVQMFLTEFNAGCP